MNFLINSLVKYIGYPLAMMLVDKLIGAIKDIFVDKEVGSAEMSKTNRQLQRKALMKSIKEAQDNEQRKQLSIILANLNNFKS